MKPNVRILVAEDDPVSSLLLQETLKEWKFEFHSVDNGADAVARHSEEQFDIAILDWMMPRVDGLEACRQMKAASTDGKPYVIMLSARASKKELMEALQTGADDYVAKPFDQVELRARLSVAERTVALNAAMRRRMDELQEALDHVKQLQDIIPICAWCKKIRSDDNYWGTVEEYLNRHDVKLSHGMCPDCLEKHKPVKKVGA